MLGFCGLVFWMPLLWALLVQYLLYLQDILGHHMASPCLLGALPGTLLPCNAHNRVNQMWPLLSNGSEALQLLSITRATQPSLDLQTRIAMLLLTYLYYLCVFV